MAAATPEGKVKARVREVLNAHAGVWHWMPVTNGLGQPGLDFVCAIKFRNRGIAFAIETKSKGKKPTPRQLLTISKMEEAGVKVFVIDGEEGVAELQTWLMQVEYLNDGSRC